MYKTLSGLLDEDLSFETVLGLWWSSSWRAAVYLNVLPLIGFVLGLAGLSDGALSPLLVMDAVSSPFLLLLALRQGLGAQQLFTDTYAGKASWSTTLVLGWRWAWRYMMYTLAANLLGFLLVIFLGPLVWWLALLWHPVMSLFTLKQALDAHTGNDADGGGLSLL